MPIVPDEMCRASLADSRALSLEPSGVERPPEWPGKYGALVPASCAESLASSDWLRPSMVEGFDEDRDNGRAGEPLTGDLVFRSLGNGLLRMRWVAKVTIYFISGWILRGRGDVK